MCCGCCRLLTGGSRGRPETPRDACLPRGRESYTVLHRARPRLLLYLPPSHLPRLSASSPASAIAAMDPIANRDNIFSRGPVTPPPPQQFSMLPGQSTEPHGSPAPSIREAAAPSSSHSHLDNLFHGLNSAPAASHVSPQPSVASANIYPGPQEQVHSAGPATPASGNAGSVSSNMSGSANQATERQNALLSLLGTVSSPSSNPQPMPPMGPVQPQQVPTPPGSAPRAGVSHSDAQGKLLLEQLMSGWVPCFLHADRLRASSSSPVLRAQIIPFALSYFMYRAQSDAISVVVRPSTPSQRPSSRPCRPRHLDPRHPTSRFRPSSRTTTNTLCRRKRATVTIAKALACTCPQILSSVLRRLVAVRCSISSLLSMLSPAPAPARSGPSLPQHSRMKILVLGTL